MRKVLKKVIINSIVRRKVSLPVVPSFTPLDIFTTGVTGAWYDPSDFSTMFQDSAGTTAVTAVGQPVGKLLDKSGRGNHATQAVSASRPLLQQAANGKYYLDFDGSDDYLDMPHIDMPSSMGAYFGISITGGAGLNRGIWSQRNNSAFGGEYLLIGGADTFMYYTGTSFSFNALVGTATTLNQTMVVSINRDSSKRIQSTASEATGSVSGYYATTKAGRLMAGGDADATAVWNIHARFYGGVVTGKNLDQTTRDNLRTYMASTY